MFNFEEAAKCDQAKRLTDRPALAADIKSAGKLLQRLSTQLEAAGLLTSTGSRRQSAALQA